MLRLFLVLTFSDCMAQSPDFFETSIRPVLARNCYACHSVEKQFASLRVDSREALLLGGQRGPAIVPGKPEDSLLFKAIQHRDLKMPVGGKLKDGDIAAIGEWIRQGAAWPKSIASLPVPDKYAQQVKQHWAFQQPVASSQRRSIDQFIRAELQRKSLFASQPANRRTLLRRLSYVLTGLPPTAEEVERFENAAVGQYEKEVDRLLASPRFGEHWARYWLDIVRYAETRGYEWNYEISGAWRYRDYVIRAFNADVPYDQLIHEHVAGDLLKQPRINEAEQINESVIGTAFYRLGEAGHDDCIQFRELATDVVDNQIDTLTKTFQGVTVSCARCHDHKLDPIPTVDYYGLYGILNSSRQVSQTIDAPTANSSAVARLRGIKARIRQELAQLWKSELPSVSTKLASLPKAEGIEDPGYLLQQVQCETVGLDEYFPAAFQKFGESYRKQAALRAEFNRTNFQPLDGWTASGMGLRDGVSSAGDFAIAGETDLAIRGIYSAGYYSFLDSNRLNGALRSIALPKNRKFVSIKSLGGRLGARRTVIDNCAIGENYKLLENDRPEWTKLETFSKQETLSVFLELVTRFDNPRLPDRPGMVKADQLKWLEEPASYFGFQKAVLHDVDESPKEELDHMLPLFAGAPPVNQKQLADRYVSYLHSVIERWALNNSTDQDVVWLNWMLRARMVSNESNAAPALTKLIEEYRRVEATLKEPRVVDGMADAGPGHDTPVFRSGDPKSFGPVAPRRLLSRILGEQPFSSQGSGRLELAERIASPSNPLTARLMVNRIWHQVFGRGIVSTVDNFGTLGEKPSHPELLDSLAMEFVQQGWSMKKLIRTMVLSETFRQSGETQPRALEVDPQNTLLHHYPLRRLAAESLRDSMLAASGELREQLYGKSIDPPREEAKDYRRLFAGPLNGNGRRSIYTKITRMEGAKFLETFDAPTPMVTRGARDVTNVPAQALTLLNDPFVILQAEALARRVLAVPDQERCDALFRFALGRRPANAETMRFNALRQKLIGMGPGGEDGLSVWKHLAHTLLNSKEFLYFQ